MSYFLWCALLTIIGIGIYCFNTWNQQPVEWKPTDVAELLRSWLSNDIDHSSWDYFESCEISNTQLESIRQKALDATYWDSPYIDSFGKPEQRLNLKGISFFKDLIEECEHIK